MKVLLINPNSFASKNDLMMKDFVGTVPPYGLLVLASALRNYGHEVFLIDQYVEFSEERSILEKIVSINPDIVGVSVLTPTFGWVRQLCSSLRRVLPKANIVFGNVFASIFYNEILSDAIADVIVHGEGEHTLAEYLDAIQNRKDLKSVKGISFRDGQSIVKNDPRPVIADLDSLAYPAWDLIDFKKYNRIPMLSLYGPTLMVQGSRGCNYNCFYCSQDANFKNFRKRKTASIIDEIEYLYQKYNVSNFIFLDAYFPFSIQNGLEFCDELIKRKLHKKIRWITETKVDLVNYDLLKHMKEAGLRLIMYGFETGSDRILKMINKHTTLDKAKKVMEETRRIGIRTLGLFMLGFPDETKQECKKTIRFAKELRCDLVKFNLLTPYPGSGLYDKYVEDKLIAYKRPELFSSWYMISNDSSASFNFSKMSLGELLAIQRLALISYYVRPWAIYNTIVKRIVGIDVIIKAIPFLFSSFTSLLRQTLRDVVKGMFSCLNADSRS